MIQRQQWFVFYTKSRQEKRVRDILLRRGYEVFLPLQKVIRQWTDRKKKVEVPLFTSYIFVKEFQYNIPSILAAPGIAWNIRHNGQPAVLHENDYVLINRFLSTGFFLEATEVPSKELQRGDSVEVVDGPLQGIRGVVSEEGAEVRMTVVVDSIERAMRVQMPAYLLRKL